MHPIVQSAVLRLHVVCPSVTLVDQDHIGRKSWKLIARTISPKLRPRPKLHDQDQKRGRSETDLVIRPQSQTPKLEGQPFPIAHPHYAVACGASILARWTWPPQTQIRDPALDCLRIMIIWLFEIICVNNPLIVALCCVLSSGKMSIKCLTNSHYVHL